MTWGKRIQIKQFLTEGESHKEVQDNMNKIADVLELHYEFPAELIKKLRAIPQGDDVFKPSDYANKLLDRVYDIADYERIWIE